jgi:uncharacterized repeat protein (TIGR01451 family)
MSNLYFRKAEIRMDRITLSVLAVFPLFTANVQAGDPFTDWSYKSRISFCGHDQDASLTNFPVLVELGSTIPGFSYLQFASPEGADLRFSDSNSVAVLNYEIEKWNSNGQSAVWVQIPELTEETSIWAYWGNTNATVAPVYATDGSTWSNSFAGVWHLTEGGTNTRFDATSNHNDSSLLGGEPDAAAGKIADANVFDGCDGTADYLQIPDAASIGSQVTSSLTVSAWLNSSSNLTSTGAFYRALEKGDSYFLLQGDGGASLGSGGMNFVLKHDDGTIKTAAIGAPLDAGTWYHLTGTFDGTEMKVYLDGVLMQTTLVGAAMDDDGLPLRIGADDSGSFYCGVLDEVRISSVARSSNWVWATYMNSGFNASFNCHEAVEQQGDRIDLAVHKSVSDSSPIIGQEISFTVLVTNLGPLDATGVVIEDQVPAGLAVLTNSATQGSYDSGSGLWTVSNLMVGASAELQLMVQVEPQAVGASIVNTASVAASDQVDGLAFNDSSSIVVQVQNLSEGLYAVFDTNMGSFTARLDYALAPLTVGSFVGLADGTRPWLNVDTGVVRSSKYFNGLIFHRVISGFVIQGGSHNGQGDGGPGYRFGDEFHPALRHDSAMILSMANSAPWTNGSQFFITLAATMNLDDKHSVFGEVIFGQNVVFDIGQVPTDAGDRPLTNVVMNTVDIMRIGSAAENFDADHPELPDASGAPATLDPIAQELTHTNSQYARHSIACTTNLLDDTSWEPIEDYFHETADEIHIVDFSLLTNGHAEAETVYYAHGKVQYTESAFFVPQNLVAKELLLTIDVGFPGEWIRIGFFSTATGAIVTSFAQAPTATLQSYDSERDEPYVLRMGSFNATPNVPISNLNLAFTTATSGPFTGSLDGTQIQGTFTIIDL